MIIVVAAIIAVLTVPLTGGSLAPLARLSLRRVWLVWLGLGLQLPITIVSIPNWLGQPLHVLTFLLAGAFIFSNWRIPGVPLLAFGAGLNLAAIAANRGTMPASAWAWRTAGFQRLSGDFANSNVVDHARLAWLGDVFAIPQSWPLSNVFSVGDVIVVVAIGYFAQAWCRRTPSIASHGISGSLRSL
ncbi:MAG: hypothetical protein QOE09_82 [Ilumatobacteraceae bacterium]|jgi:hypothetical protein